MITEMAGKLIKQISILLGVSIVTAFTVNFFSPKGITLKGQWDASEVAVTAKAKGNIASNEFEVKQVKEIYDSGKALFVDARSVENYENGHIPGAVSLPISQFDERIESFFIKYTTDHPIVTYCSGRNCEDSHKLAQLLQDFGFTQVKVFIDGFPGWQAQGYPIE